MSADNEYFRPSFSLRPEECWVDRAVDEAGNLVVVDPPVNGVDWLAGKCLEYGIDDTRRGSPGASGEAVKPHVARALAMLQPEG